MKPNKIGKQPIPTQSKRFSLPTVALPDYDYPIFCFKHLHKNFNLEQCDDSEKKSLMEQVVRMSQMTWQDLTTTQRHGLGSEKIARNALKTTCPSFITDDVSFLLAFRFQGKKPFLGHRDRFIFHVIFIDRDFSLYKH